jgi:hypothetical protein
MVELEVVRRQEREVGGRVVGVLELRPPAGGDGGGVAVTGFEGVERRVRVLRDAEGDLVEGGAVVAEDVAAPLLVALHDDLLVVAGLGQLVRAVADHQPVLPLGLVREVVDGRGHREEQLEAGHGGEVPVRGRQPDGQRPGLVVRGDAGDRVGLAVELLLTPLDEREEVAVLTGEVGVAGPLPRPHERAGKDLLAVGERQPLTDREDPLGGVLVRLERLRHETLDLGVLRVAEVDIGEPVVEGVHDLVAVQLDVEGRVDVLRRLGGERAEVDELAAGLRVTASPLVTGGGVVAAVVVVTAAGRGHEDQCHEDGDQLGDGAALSHGRALLGWGRARRATAAAGPG